MCDTSVTPAGDSLVCDWRQAASQRCWEGHFWWLFVDCLCGRHVPRGGFARLTSSLQLVGLCVEVEGVEGLASRWCLRVSGGRDLTVAHPDLLWIVNNRCLRPCMEGGPSLVMVLSVGCYWAGCEYWWSRWYTTVPCLSIGVIGVIMSFGSLLTL